MPEGIMAAIQILTALSKSASEVGRLIESAREAGRDLTSSEIEALMDSKDASSAAWKRALDGLRRRSSGAPD